jgi:iron complex outermembrane receptor protein
MLLAGSSLLAIATTTPAQETGAGFQLEEVVVTARRRAESLQDVPQTVDVVTADDVEKLNFQQFTDVQTIVPGLTMSSGSTGYTTAATIRGASFQVESSASPTVEFYLNDGPIQSVFLFQSMFDVGQIEVLRGPQGTLRGRASPSGSITVTTRQPDVSEFGGYVSALGTDEDSYQGQAAINLPIVADKLALRIAGIYDETEYDHVRSIHVDDDPYQRTKGARASLRWEASDAITASLMYQYMERNLHAYDGYRSFHLAEPTAPVVDTATNPAISPFERLSILDSARNTGQKFDIVTANLDWRFGGQKLSYVGSYSKFVLDPVGAPTDVGGVLAGTDVYNWQHSEAENKAHELRLASEERLFGALDYTVGLYYQEFVSPTNLINKTLLAMPTPGVPYSLTLAPPIPQIPQNIIDTVIFRGGDGSEEFSYFANVTWHIGDNTEVSGGARAINYKDDSLLVVGGQTLSHLTSDEDPVIWNVAASHRFTEDFMVYANIGTSWRNGPDVVGVFRPTTPNITQFTNLESEDSTSYEIGFKADFLDNRLRLNLSAFHQDFKDYIYRGPSVWYVNLGRTGAVPAQFNFASSVDATVDGVEADLQFQATENLNLGMNFAYAKGEIDNGQVACNDFDGDGVPDMKPPSAPSVGQILAAAGSTDPLVEAVASCTVNDRLSFAPDWSATLQAEYSHPITASMDIFGRGLYSYYTDNVNDPNNAYDNVGAYGLLNLYAGLRSNDGAWEVSLFARNVTDTEEILTSGSAAAATPYTNFTNGVGSSLAGAYMTNTVTPPREIGLSVRYAFGSR